MKKYKLYKFCRCILKPYVDLVYKPVVEGWENIPENKGYIICSNHMSKLDGFFMGYTTKKVVRFLAKKELFSGKKKVFFESIGCIPVDRRKKDKNALDEAIKALNNNEIVGIFPEGTINKSNDVILPFKYGAVSMAYKTGSYIVPMSLTKHSKYVKITIGKAYKVKSDDLEKENEILMNKVTKLILDNREDK